MYVDISCVLDITRSAQILRRMELAAQKIRMNRKVRRLVDRRNQYRLLTLLITHCLAGLRNSGFLVLDTGRDKTTLFPYAPFVGSSSDPYLQYPEKSKFFDRSLRPREKIDLISEKQQSSFGKYLLHKDLFYICVYKFVHCEL